VDFPGSGRSGGELTMASASIPALADWLPRFLDALGIVGPVGLAGHDIGGGVAQQVLVGGKIDINKFALVNAVMFDSWPVPGVARFRDPAVAAATTTEDVLAARRKSVLTALARPTTESEVAEYLEPWMDPRVARSWLALAGAADNRYTMELLPRLRASQTPKLLVWGEDDSFQLVEHAERFAKEIPNTQLIRIPRAGHIPMENDAVAVARALAGFFA
jgi:pimeloyl-ACP methyl ester carboxylesterase